MVPYALICPGQGAQSLGLLSVLASECKCVQETFDEATHLMSYNLWDMTQNGPESLLNQTQFTQPIVFTAEIAVYRCWRHRHAQKATAVAGHSLGEYAALVLAEVLSFEDALRLVTRRGQYMEKACGDHVGGMAVILGLDADRVESVCARISEQTQAIVAPANFNAPGQTVVSGDRAAVEQVMKDSMRHGAKRAQWLPVSVAAHCALMRSASECLKKDLECITFKQPKIPIVQNTWPYWDDTRDPEVIRSRLMDQMTAPVPWIHMMQVLIEKGIRCVVECGPGSTLTGLMKRITASVRAFPIDTAERMQTANRYINGCNE